MKRAVIATTLLLGACSKSLPLAEPLRPAVEAFITKEFGAREPLEFDQLWHAGALPESSLVCGDFKSPSGFDNNPPRLRFVFDTVAGHGQVEFHRNWIASSASSQAIMDENRRIFDQMWSTHCGPFRPWSIGSLLGLA